LRKIWLTFFWWLNGDWMVYTIPIWLPSPTINGVLYTILCWCYSLGWSGEATGDGMMVKSIKIESSKSKNGSWELLMAMNFMTFK
jgi:hypothetical protein